MIFHNSGKGLAALAATLVVGLAFAKPVNATTYKVIDLGTLGGANSAPMSIASNGNVAGYAQINSAGNVHGFVYTAGNVVDLGVLSGQMMSEAYGVNAAGVVAGYSGSKGFLYGVGVMKAIPSMGGNSSRALAINDLGHATGDSQNASMYTRAYIFNPAMGMIDIGTPGGTNATGYSINNSDHIAGYGLTSGNKSTHAFFYNGSMHDLGTLGGTWSYAYHVSDNDTVAGYSYTAGNTTRHAFVWTPGGGLKDLGVLGAGAFSIAYGCDNLGHIVGTSGGHGVIWDSAGIHDLNSLLASSGGWLVTTAYGINDAGVIAVSGSKSGVQHSLLLVP